MQLVLRVVDGDDAGTRRLRLGAHRALPAPERGRPQRREAFGPGRGDEHRLARPPREQREPRDIDADELTRHVQQLADALVRPCDPARRPHQVVQRREAKQMPVSRGVVPHDEGAGGERKHEKGCHPPIDTDQLDGGDRDADAGDRSREGEQQRPPRRDVLVSLRLPDPDADDGLGQRCQSDRDERAGPSQRPLQILETWRLRRRPSRQP